MTFSGGSLKPVVVFEGSQGSIEVWTSPSAAHLQLKSGEGTVVTNFHGPGTLDHLIAVLIASRMVVWGDPSMPAGSPRGTA